MTERGIYYISEPLTDVQFRLRLEYSGPIASVLQPYGDFTENVDEQPSPVTSSISVEECTFKWQQKLQFRKNRVPQPKTQPSHEQQEHFGQEEMPTDVDEGGNRIFTLVDGEEPAGNKKDTVNLDTIDEKNKFAERIAISRSRRIEPTTMSHRNPVIDLPHKEHQIKIRTVQHIKQTMYIMAYLGPIQDNSDAYDERNEYILCKITAINGTNIMLEPDLFSQTVTIESHYGIYTARLFLVKNEFDRIDDANSDQPSFREESITLDDLPPEGSTKLIYLIDIERAVNFPHDGLRIEYKVDLPVQCALISLFPVHGLPISDSSPQQQDDVAVFSQPVFATMIIKEGEQFPENFHWPRMIFRVCAEDYWGRFFVDGYGLLTLPSQPGRHQFDVKCWKFNHNNDRKSMLFEYFIAQASDFKKTDLNLPIATASSTTGTMASSIGLSTTTSGILKINVQCIMQSRKFISQEFLQEMKYGTLVRRAGMHSRIHWKILKVLSEFEEARRNLLRIRNQPIPSVNRKI